MPPRRAGIVRRSLIRMTRLCNIGGLLRTNQEQLDLGMFDGMQRRVAPAAYSQPESNWISPNPRPVRIFPPEPIVATGSRPPERFRWRRMALTTGRATGPERITPEWWLDDPGLRSGLRDYWRVETLQGRRLWLFHTPQQPGWFVQGEFA